MSKDQVLKQCIGFLNTPPLWIKEQFGIQQFEFPDIDFGSFQVKAIPPKIRLGHQMEYVFKQLIDYSSAYELELHNLPVRDGKQTIGEIDFILKEKMTQQLIHIELTYKFYIINLEISAPIHQLMGPNRRDMFFTKMEKIKNDQFTLIHTPEGSKALIDMNIDPGKIIHKACYKAQLFEPYGAKPLNIRPLNPKCIVGSWLSFDDFNGDFLKNYQFYIPFKSQWVIAIDNDVLWMSHYQALLEINLRMLKENAPMVWMKKSATEFEKFFVVWW